MLKKADEGAKKVAEAKGSARILASGRSVRLIATETAPKRSGSATSAATAAHRMIEQ